MNVGMVRSAVVAVLGCSLGCDVAGASDVAEPVAADAPRGGHGFAGGGPQRGGAPMGQRWVLRDAMGTAIDAVVEPTCGGGVECVINELGSQGALNPPCVRAFWLGDDYVDLRYSLASGLAADCAPHMPNLSDIGWFLDAGCAGPIYDVPGGGVDDTRRWTRRVYHVEATDKVYYESASEQLVTTYYSGADGGCVAGEQDAFVMVEWREIPDELTSLPGVAPYSITWD